MAGSISLSMSQQFDDLGKPLSGGLLYFIEAGTTSTPQNAYQDSALTLPWPNPIVLDAAGRIPQFYLADGSIKIRLTDSAGVQQLVADNVLVVGPSSGSGGGGTVDATTIFTTGDVKHVYGTGTISGWVRANGRTIGSSTSGATERANSDTQALFEYLWGADAGLTVSSGRGASANADWVTNKTITLPDFRGRVLAGMDDMGNTAAGRLTSAGVITGTTLGYGGGSESHTLTASQMPSHSHSGTTSIESNGHTHGYQYPIGIGVLVASGADRSLATSSQTQTSSSISDHHTHTFTTSLTGSDTAHNNVQPTITVTMYIKL